MPTAINEYTVIVTLPESTLFMDVLADSSSDAIVQVMDIYPDAKRISARLAGAHAAPAAPGRTACEELGICQSLQPACRGCRQPAPAVGPSTWAGAALEQFFRRFAWRE